MEEGRWTGLGMSTIHMVAVLAGCRKAMLGWFLLLFSINGRRNHSFGFVRGSISGTIVSQSGGAFTCRRAQTIECLLMSVCAWSRS